MKLEVGQSIIVEGVFKLNIVGEMSLGSYIDCKAVDKDGQVYWIDNCRSSRGDGEHRLWHEMMARESLVGIPGPYRDKARRYMWGLCRNKNLRQLRKLQGHVIPEFGNVTITSIGTESVRETNGDVDETEVGEAVIWLEGVLPSGKLLCVEVWGGEMEFYMGEAVEVEMA